MKLTKESVATFFDKIGWAIPIAVVFAGGWEVVGFGAAFVGLISVLVGFCLAHGMFSLGAWVSKNKRKEL